MFVAVVIVFALSVFSFKGKGLFRYIEMTF